MTVMHRIGDCQTSGHVELESRQEMSSGSKMNKVFCTKWP